MLYNICLIIALVSSYGDTINVDHLRYLKPVDNHCLIYQTYNPYVIKSDWTCKQVEDSIIFAIQNGCKNNS